MTVDECFLGDGIRHCLVALSSEWRSRVERKSVRECPHVGPELAPDMSVEACIPEPHGRLQTDDTLP